MSKKIELTLAEAELIIAALDHRGDSIGHICNSLEVGQRHVVEPLRRSIIALKYKLVDAWQVDK